MGRRCSTPGRCGSFGLFLGLWAGIAGIGTFAAPHAPGSPATTEPDVTSWLPKSDTRESHCVTAGVQTAIRESGVGSLPPRRAFGGAPQRRAGPVLDRSFRASAGFILRYTNAPSSSDRIRVESGSGLVPEIVRSAAMGLQAVRRVLVEELDFPDPGEIEVVFVRLPGGVRGHALPPPGRPAGTIVLDANPAGGAEESKRVAAHQFAHVVLTRFPAPGLPADWIEGISGWAQFTIGAEDDVVLEAINRRLRNLDRGLTEDGDGSGLSHALWLLYLDQIHGRAAVRATIEDLAQGLPVAEALDQGLRRSVGTDLDSAFRDFQLWTLAPVSQVGDRLVTDRLDSPNYAADVSGVPALSVRADSPLGPWGAAAVRIRPNLPEGGFHVFFEGDGGARWRADLILVDATGVKRRLALPIENGARGDLVVPAEGVEEALLLVRRIDGELGVRRPYTWAAQLDRGFPFELEALAARPAEDEVGVLVSWTTTGETGVLGFNVLRSQQTSAEPGVPVNPVWIPAVGSEVSSVSYHFVDRTAEAEQAYLYHVQAVTFEGLTVRSDGALVLVPSRSQ